jgi:aminopeptidase N
MATVSAEGKIARRESWSQIGGRSIARRRRHCERWSAPAGVHKVAIVPSSCSRTEAVERSALLDVRNYEVHLDFLSDPTFVVSRTTVRFGCRRPGSATFAQLTADEVERIELNGRRLDTATFVSDGRVVLEGLAGENELIAESVHRYDSDGHGFSRKVQSDGSVNALVYAYPTSASSIFCCFDQPDLGAPLRLSVEVPAGWDCITHARAVSRPPVNRPGVWRFEIASMKPQELMVALGRYCTILDPDGAKRQVRLLCRPALADDVNPERLGHLVRSSLDFYGEFFEAACPYDWLDVAFVPELPSLAVCVPGLVAFHEDLARRIADPDDDFATMVVGHELAHLWFGCLVDCNWWDDLWLAEGLATWASFVAGGQRLSMHTAWAEFSMADKERAYAADQLPTTEAVSAAVESAASATARPSGLTYSKSAAIVRQLEALIGEDAVRHGLRLYFERFSGGTAALEDIVACWSEASGQDLSTWTMEWLRTPGVNLLRAELSISPDGTIESLDIVQKPSEVRGTPAVLRHHRFRLGLYEESTEGLRRRHAVDVEVAGERTSVTELVGCSAPAVLLLNDGDLAYARLRFDAASLSRLTENAVELGDPVTEAVCWTVLWDMATSAELDPRQFIECVARQIESAGLPPGIAVLGTHAVRAADYYATPSARVALRARVAGACGDRLASERAQGREWRKFAFVLAKSAATPPQLDTLRQWLENGTLREAWGRDIVRGVLETLAAAGQLDDELLEQVTALDPASGAEIRVKCRALRPSLVAKEDAWYAALRHDTPLRLAQAHADGIWTPAQEGLMLAWRERYFVDTLAALSAMPDNRARRVGAAMYPLTLVDDETLSATDEALRAGGLSRPVQSVLEEQREKLRRMVAARFRFRQIRRENATTDSSSSGPRRAARPSS